MDLATQPNASVATLAATPLAAQGAGAEADTVLKMAVLLLEGLSGNVMSGDVWFLSQLYAKKRAEMAGMDAAIIEESLAHLMSMIDRNRKANPMSSMF